MPPHSDAEFAEILMEAVDQGLSLLGESAQKSISYHLEKDHGIGKENAPDNVEAFAKGLHAIFGAGASVIERMILQSLYLKLGLDFKQTKDSSFGDCVHKAKEVWLSRQQRQENALDGIQHGASELPARISKLVSPVLQHALSTSLASMTRVLHCCLD